MKFSIMLSSIWNAVRRREGVKKGWDKSRKLMREREKGKKSDKGRRAKRQRGSLKGERIKREEKR